MFSKLQRLRSHNAESLTEIKGRTGRDGAGRENGCRAQKECLGGENIGVTVGGHQEGSGNGAVGQRWSGASCRAVLPNALQHYGAP